MGTLRYWAPRTETASQEQKEFDAFEFAFLSEPSNICANEKEVLKILNKNQDLACLR